MHGMFGADGGTTPRCATLGDMCGKEREARGDGFFGRKAARAHLERCAIRENRPHGRRSRQEEETDQEKSRPGEDAARQRDADGL